MASYREDYYSEVDSIFDKLKADPFAKPISDPTQYEIGGVGHIQPVGWVQNASSVDGSANVIIDADGITIYDGKIFLYDYGGSSVLGAAGFAGSWIDFITGRVYNGIFRNGTPGNLALTETGGADTSAEYEASLSSIIPYWIVSVKSGTDASTTLLADSTAPGGQVIHWDGTSFNTTIYQDIPVTPGRAYMALMLWKYTNSTSEFSRNMRWSWRDKDHALIGSVVADGLAYTTSQSAYKVEGLVHPNGDLAPTNAAYVRIEVNMTRSSGSPDVYLAGLALQEATVFGPIRYVGTSYALDTTDDVTAVHPKFRLSTDGAMEWGNGASTPDTSFIRSSGGQLMAQSPTSGTALLRARGTNTVGFASDVDSSDTSARVFLGHFSTGVPRLEFGTGGTRDVIITRLSGGSIILRPGTGTYSSITLGSESGPRPFIDWGSGGADALRIGTFGTDGNFDLSIHIVADSTVPKIGFLGAAAVSRPTVTGSKGGNAALSSLMSALANLGLVTNSTT